MVFSKPNKQDFMDFIFNSCVGCFFVHLQRIRWNWFEWLREMVCSRKASGSNKEGSKVKTADLKLSSDD